MKLNKLSIKDKDLFDRFFALENHNLSNYSFVNVFIWMGLFDIFWAVLDESLCLFLKDRFATFMYLPPLGRRRSGGLIEQGFSIMDGLNQNRAYSRIENVPQEDIDFYGALGYQAEYHCCDYVYATERLAGLKGNRFKASVGRRIIFLSTTDFRTSRFRFPAIRSSACFYAAAGSGSVNSPLGILFIAICLTTAFAVRRSQ